MARPWISLSNKARRGGQLEYVRNLADMSDSLFERQIDVCADVTALDIPVPPNMWRAQEARDGLHERLRIFRQSVTDCRAAFLLTKLEDRHDLPKATCSRDEVDSVLRAVCDLSGDHFAD